MIGDSAYVVGGFHHGNNFEFPLDDIERLDVGVSNAAWTKRREMDVARGDKAVAALHNVLHVIGGETKRTMAIPSPCAMWRFTTRRPMSGTLVATSLPIGSDSLQRHTVKRSSSSVARDIWTEPMARVAASTPS